MFLYICKSQENILLSDVEFLVTLGTPSVSKVVGTGFHLPGQCTGVRTPWFLGQGFRVKSLKWSGRGKVAFRNPAMSFLTDSAFRSAFSYCSP